MKKRWFTFRTKSQKGQSFVEMAVITPILLFMFFGLIEVGWALRGYLITANINREVTRRAVRPGYLDFQFRVPNDVTQNRNFVGYDSNIMSYFANVNGGTDPDLFILPELLRGLQYPYPRVGGNVDPDTGDIIPTADLTMGYFVVNTGFPCENKISGGNWDCDCTQFDIPGGTDFATFDAKAQYEGIAQNFTYDDLFLYPDKDTLPGYDHYLFTQPETSDEHPPRTRLIDRYGSYQNFVYVKALENAKFNCELLKKGVDPDADAISLQPSNNGIIYAELFFNQPQLLGFPLLSIGSSNPVGAPVTDPIAMYSQTSMRLMSSSRQGVDSTSVGAVCAPLPIVGSDELLNFTPQFDGGTRINIVSGNPLNILQGVDQWVSWGGSSDFDYLKYEFQFPQMALNERLRLGEGPLEVGKSLSTTSFGLSGAQLDELETIIAGMAGQEVIIPLGSGSLDAAAVVILTGEVDLNPTEVDAMGDPIPPYIEGYFLRSAYSECFDTHYPCPLDDAGLPRCGVF